MIPKIIHYCWLSDEPIPFVLLKYIEGWKSLMPDYKFVKWDKSIFNIDKYKWVKDAYNNRKWAFASDYVRAYALYNEGGFYLDSDVLLNKSLDEFLSYGFVSSIEFNPSLRANIKESIDSNYNRSENNDFVFGFGIQAAIIGSEKGHPFVGELLDYYNNNSFVLDNNKFNMVPAPMIYAKYLEKYGFVYQDKTQRLKNNIVLFKSNVFASFQTCTFTSYAIHMCFGSWVDNKKNNKVLSKVKKNLFLRKVLNIFFNWYPSA